MHPLIKLGVRQFKYIPLEFFSEAFLQELSDCRSQPKFRQKKVDKSEFLLIVSQDCDIDSDIFDFIEVLSFKKAARKDLKSPGPIEYARNVHKILIKDAESFLLKKEDSSLITKSSLEGELERIKLEKGDLNLLNFQAKNTNIILLAWLVNYYARRPLPDGFNRTLFGKYIKNPEGHPLQALLLEYFEEIADVHAFISPMEDEDAEVYDVTLTALLHSDCSAEKSEIIECKLRGIIDAIDATEPRLNMMQSKGMTEHEEALMDYVLEPHLFSKADEYKTRRLLLDFMCWTPKDDN
jgi:hypothetical protein